MRPHARADARLRSTASEITRIPTGASFRARFKHPYIIIHRIDLHNVLLDACRREPTIELVAGRHGHAVFEDRGDRVARDDRGRPHASQARR